ncbi:MAG: hypothetical protein ACXV3D_00180 [Halobacteriota archaeon]
MVNIVQITGYVVACLAAGPQSTDYLNFVSEAIMIYCEDDYKLYLVFTDGPLPDWATNTYDATNYQGIAFLNVSQYPHYIDLLRNEGPLAVEFITSETPPAFAIATTQPEGIGEGEIAGTLDQIRGLLASNP